MARRAVFPFVRAAGRKARRPVHFSLQQRPAVMALVFIALAMAWPLAGADGVGDDPFRRPMPAALAGPTPPGALDAFELTGVASAGGLTRVCLTDRATRVSRWLVVGAATEGLVATEFDRARDAVRLQHGAESRWVGLRRAEIVAMALPTREHGAIDWAHLRLSDKEKAREAEAMVTDIMEVAQEGRTGRLRQPH
ncbi:MAG: hypothetical protein IAE82_11540 [Opitutaceae bacterium]|nr:hypothetical protein [Opitutaceae bacterium]